MSELAVLRMAVRAPEDIDVFSSEVYTRGVPHEQVLARVEHMEITDAPSLLRSSFIHGIKHLPVSVR